MEQELWRQQCHRSFLILGPLVYEPVYAVHFGRKSFGIGFGPARDGLRNIPSDLVRVNAGRDQSGFNAAVRFNYSGKTSLIKIRNVAEIR